MTLRGDELDLVGMTFPFLFLIYPNIHTNAHTAVSSYSQYRFLFYPQRSLPMYKRGHRAKKPLCSLSNPGDPISRVIKWTHLRTKENIRNFDLLLLHFLRRETEIQKKTDLSPYWKNNFVSLIIAQE